MARQALLEHVASSSLKVETPVIEPGMTVRVHQKIIEGAKERTQVFEGLVIAVNNGVGINGTFTVRKLVESIGVEKTFPLHAATTPKIEVVKQAKIRRAKLYYMRERTGKSARLKETYNTVVYDEDVAKKAHAEKAVAAKPAPAAEPAPAVETEATAA